MKKKLIVLASILSIGAIAVGVSQTFRYKKKTEPALEVPEWRKAMSVTNENYVPVVDEFDINKDTDSLGGRAAKYYSKYIDYVAPNEKPIRIVAQHEVSDEQLLYAHAILTFYLKNLSEAVVNQLADNEEVLVMPNGSDRDGKTPMRALFGQNLNQEETVNVGSTWYVENDYEYRDAAFEEIFHLVHDFGIGTTQNPQADDTLAQLIANAQQQALPQDKARWGQDGLWGFDSLDWLIELEEEGSLEQEYVASVIDSYYGLWEAYPDSDKGMFGGYIAKTREDIAKKDPAGYEMITSFLPEHINTFMRIDPSFEGDFKMYYDKSTPYTFKSQYLTMVRLTGDNDSNLIGNDHDNVFMGNAGTNVITGGKGFDVIQFVGKQSEYQIEKSEQETIITDLIKDREGIIIAKDIEVLRFTDVDINLKKD